MGKVGKIEIYFLPHLPNPPHLPSSPLTPSSFAKQQLAGKILGSNTTLQCSGSGKVNLASQTSNTLRKANGQKAATAVTKNCGHL